MTEQELERLTYELSNAFDLKIKEIRDINKLSDENTCKIISAFSVSILSYYVKGFDNKYRLDALNKIIYHVKNYMDSIEKDTGGTSGTK